MTDLRNAYSRANTCVACHEYLPPDIAKAGHPELIFELDSQIVSEPPHWHETDPWIGLHSWLAGQAVAFREDTWHVLNMAPGSSSRWEALGWILQQTTASLTTLTPFSIPEGPIKPGRFAALQTTSDTLARTAASFPWTTTNARLLLQHLASAGAAIQQLSGADRQLHHAQVLVQAMDRLLVALNQHAVTIPGAARDLDALFADVHLQDSFNPAKFSQDLTQFSTSVGNL
jgi:hypothetical protein